ncbi:MAG: hypothetical protein LQ352_007098, partial [Teloschistes flavicans]
MGNHCVVCHTACLVSGLFLQGSISSSIQGCILTIERVGVLLGLEIPRHSHRVTSGVELIVSRWGLPSSSAQKDLTNWPNQFTHDVTPIPCHSHNDYWRRVPLYDALAAGCTGVEADVWLDPTKPNDLFVGHTQKSLTPVRTLKA